MVGVVGDAGGGDGLEELGLREFPGQAAQVLVDQGAEWDAGEKKAVCLKDICFVLRSFCPESLVSHTLVCRGAAPPRFRPQPC